jgi:hypothetical protein
MVEGTSSIVASADRHMKHVGRRASNLPIPAGKVETASRAKGAASTACTRDYKNTKSVGSIDAPFMKVMTSCEAPPL